MTICGGIAIAAGAVLILIAIVVPIIIHGILEDKIPAQVAISKNNEDVWSALPGKYDVEIIKKYIVFNCTNPEEVGS